jgi:DNA-binding LacI/PurR family transcriptional regulator
LSRTGKKQVDKLHSTGPTMADLAKLAGLSKITVSRALSDSPLVNPETRERIRELAHKHGYKLNISARNLRLRRSHTVAVIVEMKPSSDRTMFDPYPLGLLGGISQELTAAGYSVLLTTRQGANAAAVQAADGLILLGQGVHQDAVHRFDKLGVPMVVWGAGLKDDSHVVVGSDNRLGGAVVADHFFGLGRRRPVFIGNPSHPEIYDRLNGFVDALGVHGIKPLLMRRDEFTPDSGADAVRSLHARWVDFDAIFACSDLLAMGAIRGIQEMGRSVPGDVSVVGYDDMPLGASFLPPLSSVRQDWQEGGILLARKVLALIRDEPAESEILPVSLIVRAT